MHIQRKYMDGHEEKRLSHAVEHLTEMDQLNRHPLPLRHQIVRIMGLLISSAVLMVIGCAMALHSNNIAEQVLAYGSTCEGEQLTNYSRTCDTLTITINQKISQPVYLYYHLTHFWQNHFLFVRSLSEGQLFEDVPSDTEACEETKNVLGVDEDGDGRIIIPCGVQAWSHFNDEITVNVKDSQGVSKCTDCLDNTNIALDIDKNRFDDFNANSTDHDGYTSTVPAEDTWGEDGDASWGRLFGHSYVRGPISNPNIQDESLMVWMRYAPTSNFKKIHSIIHQDLEQGDVLEFSIINKFNSDIYNGKKELILTEAGSFGGKHQFLSTVFILSGLIPFSIVCATLVVHFYKAKANHNPVW